MTKSGDRLIAAAKEALELARNKPVDQIIDDNANLIKWCVTITGIDEIYPVEDFRAAIKDADQHNKEFGENIKSGRFGGKVLMVAYACPWPYSAEDHAASLKAQKASR